MADSPRVHELPATGSLVIGRTDDADIVIDHDSISRRHALLHIGQTMAIEDLDSSNGTFVGGVRLQTHERGGIEPGDYFELGGVICLLRGRTHRGRLRQLRSHSYFEARLVDEVDRARADGGRVGVIRLHVTGDDAAIERTLLDSLHPGDVVARYAPSEYEIMCAGASARDADATAQSLLEKLATLGQLGRAGVAAFPRDGSSAEELFASACRALLPASAASGEPGSELVVADENIEKLHRLVERVAAAEINVLLLGETGVGKEVFAERLHRASPRADGEFVRLNCAAFADTLLESELFGHEKGAFTGATASKVGLLETAHGGIVFLDEIGELELGMQAKLLRVIETRKFRRVGGVKEREADVVFVSATNRDLDAEIAGGRFRNDLFFRLNGFSLTIPPLRDRPGEIEPLARSFMARAAARMNLPEPSLSDEARDLLLRHAWPGNIRELRNTIDRAVLLADGETITGEHLPVDNMSPPPAHSLRRAVAAAVETAEAPPDLTDEERAERARIVAALAEALNNQTRAAEILGISRRWLGTLMNRYQIPRARKPR